MTLFVNIFTPTFWLYSSASLIAATLNAKITAFSGLLCLLLSASETSFLLISPIVAFRIATFRSLRSWGIDVTGVELVPSVRDAFGYYFQDAPMILSDHHVQVVIDDGRRFLKRTNKKFDLVLLDIRMPRVDGFEVLKFIKKNYPAVRVIMLTGFADLKNAIESKKNGAEDFISKPYDLVDLLTTIERVLNE